MDRSYVCMSIRKTLVTCPTASTKIRSHPGWCVWGENTKTSFASKRSCNPRHFDKVQCLQLRLCPGLRLHVRGGNVDGLLQLLCRNGRIVYFMMQHILAVSNMCGSILYGSCTDLHTGVTSYAACITIRQSWATSFSLVISPSEAARSKKETPDVKVAAEWQSRLRAMAFTSTKERARKQNTLRPAQPLPKSALKQNHA